MTDTKKILIALGAIILILSGMLTYSYTSRPRSFMDDKNLGFRNDRFSDRNTQDRMNSDNKGMGNGRDISNRNCLSDQCLLVDNLDFPVGTLTNEAKDALSKALDDEYKAYASYDAIIKKLGNVRPFIMILRAEEQHISSLKALFDKYGITIPENPYINKITASDALQDACKVGIDAEKANVSLYEDTLLPVVHDYEDISYVFTSLMNASKNNHLKAFERCVN